MRTGFAEIRDRFNAADYLRRIDPERILEHYGARNMTDSRSRDGSREIIHSCLIDQVEPHHANRDENPSAAMNTDKATYACYGYWMGGIFDFVMKMEQKEYLTDVIDVLVSFLGDDTGSGADRASLTSKLEELFRRGTVGAVEDSPGYAHQAIAKWVGVRHPYATEERKITDRAYEHLHLGYDPDTRRLVFPHYVGGKLVGWQQRAIPDRPGVWPGSVSQVPKYKNNSSFPKSSTVYRLDEARRSSAPVVVVESPMSVARAVSLGFDNVVALFGASAPPGQIAALQSLGKPLVIWMDDDPAGYRAEEKLMEGLARHVPVSVVVPQKGRDMGDAQSLNEIERMVASAKPAVLRRMDHLRGPYGR